MRALSIMVAGVLAACSDPATQVGDPGACDSGCGEAGGDASDDAPTDAPNEAAADASADAGAEAAPPDPGVSCGPQACDNTLPCCARGQQNAWQYSCELNCAAPDAGEAHKFVCDDSADCPSGSVCCSSGAPGVIDATHCASAASCVKTVGAVVCDPANAPECPGKCTGNASAAGLTFHTCA